MIEVYTIANHKLSKTLRDTADFAETHDVLDNGINLYHTGHLHVAKIFWTPRAVAVAETENIAFLGEYTKA